VLENQAHAAVCCERTVTPPFGLDGGLAGAPARLELIAPRSYARELTSKGGFLAPAGSLVVVEAPGSGGYGPPSARNPVSVSEDLLDGYITPAVARLVYGPVIGEATEPALAIIASAATSDTSREAR
jgi:N-methylhydantoinase B